MGALRPISQTAERRERGIPHFENRVIGQLWRLLAFVFAPAYMAAPITYFISLEMGNLVETP